MVLSKPLRTLGSCYFNTNTGVYPHLSCSLESHYTDWKWDCLGNHEPLFPDMWSFTGNHNKTLVCGQLVFVGRCLECGHLLQTCICKVRIASWGYCLFFLVYSIWSSYYVPFSVSSLHLLILDFDSAAFCNCAISQRRLFKIHFISHLYATLCVSGVFLYL